MQRRDGVVTAPRAGHRPVQVLWTIPVRAATIETGLSSAERDRMEKMRAAGAPPADQDSFATSRALLRAALGAWMGVGRGDVTVRSVCSACGGADHGRPVVPQVLGAARPPQISLTHAGDVVAVAISDVGPVGVDVEPHREPFDGFDDVALAPAERAELRTLEPRDATTARLRAWVRKEAVLKATGAGLAVDPRGVVVRGCRGRPELVRLPAQEDVAGWRLWDLDLAGPGVGAAEPVGSAPAIGAVAVRHGAGPSPDLRVTRVEPRQLTW